MRIASFSQPPAGRVDVDVEDVCASESDELICLGTIAKPPNPSSPRERIKDRQTPALLMRASDSDQPRRATGPQHAFKDDSASGKCGIRQNSESEPTRFAEPPGRRTSRSSVRNLPSKHRHAVPAAIIGHSVILGWARNPAGQKIRPKVQASFSPAGRFSFRLVIEPCHRNGVIVSFEKVELVPQFRGKNRGEVRVMVQQFLENELGLSADCGEV
jgi:hypothetical protein